MIDTHCHLTDERLLEQLGDVLSRAAAAGVSRMITVATHPQDWRPALVVCHGRPWLRCTLGIHPNYSHEAQLSDFDQMLPMVEEESAVVALGEMGLDYHCDNAPKKTQATFFETQLLLARQMKKPVVIHCREAVEDTLAILHGFEDVPAVFHCFTGTVDEAKKILDRGYFLGLTGVATYKNAAHLREVAALVPDDRLFVETDAPYLTPEPMRKQKVNEPALVMYTAQTVAAARGISLEQLDELTTENALNFFQTNELWESR